MTEARTPGSTNHQSDGTSGAARRVWVVRCLGAASAIVVGLLVQIGHGLAADAPSPSGWLCVADKAAGFRYNKSTKSWSAAVFTTDSKYVVRIPTDKDIKELESINQVSQHSTPPAYIVRVLGQDDDMSIVPATCENPPSAETGLMVCEGGLMQFAVNVHLLRMQRYYGIGYLHQDGKLFPSFEDHPGTPYIEIGRCSPL